MIPAMARRRIILAAFLASLAANAWFVVRDAGQLTLPALLLGWYWADMSSGLVHMYMDYRKCPPGKRLHELFFYQGSRESREYQEMFRERMAAISPFERVVYDFKNHHPRPEALGRRKLWWLIGSTVMLAALPQSLLLNAAELAWAVPGWVAALFFSLIAGSAFAQYFHATLHRSENPWIVDAMRRLGLLMTPEAHQLHHDTLRRDFSTNCGWSNPLVNLIFRRLRRRGYLDDAGLAPGS
jgi:hypothetical protein